MLLEILKYPDKRLYNKSEEIKTITEEIKILAENMAETMYNAHGAGIAAPQVNQFIRLIAMDPSGPEKREQLCFLINPSYTILDPSTMKEEEGCLSVPDCKEKIGRYSKILVTALDLDGNRIEFEAEDYIAVIVQHEVDHLDGKLFINRLSHLKRSLYAKKIRKKIEEESENKKK